MKKHAATLPALYALFALSGFCGLIYESIWSHYLKLFVGHAAYAQTLVLAVFMGGMGLGAWLVSRLTVRISNLLWGYALAELLIGLSALAFHPAFGLATAWAHATLLPSACAPEGFCAAHWVLASLFILPQSMLLGTTFPLMTGGVLRLAPADPGRKLALLYFLNSIGAVAGVLASGFLLIPAFGLPGALLTAGLGNIFLAVAVYFLGKPAGSNEAKAAAEVAADVAADMAADVSADMAPHAVAPPVTARVSAAPAPLLAMLLAVSLLTGLSSFIYEVAWIRMLSMVLGSATHSFEIMLASFILGLALGGWWIRSRIDGIRQTLVFLACVQLAMGALALLTLPLYNHTFDAMAWLMGGLARSESGYALFTLALTAISLAVMLPATFCAGMTLPLITYRLYRQGSGERAIGQVYAANTLGAIAGVLLTVHLLMPGLGLKGAMVIGAAIDIALGIFLLAPKFRNSLPLRRPVAGLAVAALAIVIAAPWVYPLDPLRMNSSVFRVGRASLDEGTSVLFSKDGKTSTVHVARFTWGTTSLSTNGKSDGAIQMDPAKPVGGDELTMTLLGALPLAYLPGASDVAVIGFGTGMSSATLLGSPHLKRLDTIEIEPAMVEAAQHFRPVNELAFTDPRHHVVIEDAKSHFSRGRRRYDIIVSEPSNPWVSGVASLFTEEFYARARQHLNDDGLFVQWMHVYEITPELVASVFRAMTKSFPVYEIYMGTPGDMIIVAPAGGRMPQRTAALFDMPAVKTMLARAGIANDNQLSLQYLSNQRGLGPVLASYGATANSDFFPLVDLQGPKARYMGANATALTVLHTLDAPVLRALDGNARVGFDGDAPPSELILPRQLPYVRARQWASFVRDGVVPPQGLNHLGDMDLALIVRLRLFACRGSSLSDAPWEGVVKFAAETIPYLDAATGTALWQAVRASPCLRALSAAQRRWIDMFWFVAADRWEEAGALAERLLAEAEPSGPYQRLMLTQVSATAHVKQGRGEQAAKVLDAQLANLPAAERGNGWVRLLAAHAKVAGQEAGGRP